MRRRVKGVSDSRRERRGEAEGPTERPSKAELAPQRIGFCIRQGLAVALALCLVLASAPAMGQGFSLINGGLQKRVNGVLALMQYTMFPDVTTSSLAISSTNTGNPAFQMVQAGGGFTWSKSFPLYLEGNAAWARYDPTFVATDGAAQRDIAAKWNSITGMVGVGWDFPLTPITPELVLRPIGNFMLGHMTSDLTAVTNIIEGSMGQEIRFLQNGEVNALATAAR